MSRAGKIFLGILTCLPFVFFAIYLSLFLQFFFEVWRYHRSDPQAVFFQMLPSFVFIALLVVAKVGLLVYYIIHAINNKRIDPTERLVWVLVFVFVGIIGFPIYWYARIWKEGSSVPPSHAYQ